MKKRKQISLDEARHIGESLYIDWDQVNLEQFHQGLMGNHKPGAIDPETELLYEGVLHTGKLVLAHMQEFPDYFTRLAKLKAEVESDQTRRR
ncbi:MAG: hypothetical protein C4583_09540 [Anaerolineaceae bacterium]|nr:MAG: hypothetical protein C4583_09540 [Anaerolineaceae bacterium]